MPAPEYLDPRLTEHRNPRTERIDVASPLEIVDLINSEDATVAAAVHREREAVARAIELTVAAFQGGGRLIYVGAGTSGRLGVLDASECPPTFGTPPELGVGGIAGGLPGLVKSQEGAEDDVTAVAAAMDRERVEPRDFVLGIAASGTTPFVRAALSRAQTLGAVTGLVSCSDPPQLLTGTCDVLILPKVGPEVLTGSTRMKAATATKLVLNTITTGAMIRMGRAYGNLMVDLMAWSDKLRDRSERIVMECCQVDRGAARRAIEAAGGSAKLAIVMVKKGLAKAEAERLLQQAGGFVRRAVGDPPPVTEAHGRRRRGSSSSPAVRLRHGRGVADRVGVRVVSDFRSRDVAAGGQGAPLVPLADVMLFGHPERGRLLLNLGGMANITWVPRRGVIDGAVAFDTGPGVAVIDAVTRRVDPDAGYDQDGERARRGHPDLKALHQLLTDPFFDQPPPKSTGRERFGIEFADRLIALVQGAGGSANDAVATATALTAETVARGMERWTPPLPPGAGDELVISGGGARNPALVELLAGRVRPRPVVPFDQLFFDGEAKEALAFAFLGFLTLAGKPGNLPAATGARGPRVLGSVTPA